MGGGATDGACGVGALFLSDFGAGGALLHPTALQATWGGARATAAVQGEIFPAANEPLTGAEGDADVHERVGRQSKGGNRVRPCFEDAIAVGIILVVSGPTAAAFGQHSEDGLVEVVEIGGEGGTIGLSLDRAAGPVDTDQRGKHSEVLENEVTCVALEFADSPFIPILPVAGGVGR